MGTTVTLPVKEQAEEFAAAQQLSIACCGDSHTRGGFPQELQQQLQRAYPSVAWRVLNFGNCGATASRTARAYGASVAFKQSLASAADVVTLMLGTNDAHKVYWSERGFVESVTSLVKQIQHSDRPPLILLGVPPPLYHRGHAMSSMLKQQVVNRELPRLIPQLAEELKVAYFDAFSALGGARLQRPDAMLADGVHLNQVGRQILGQVVADAVLVHKGLVVQDSPRSSNSSDSPRSFWPELLNL
ncbi:unnamed protein product [Effrenium voratum]|uniref:SGNH hydrolase-type esterase domain-containing protein n=1 Tax=Effrenium voratum TaxID=2562239 RepID=A0AA36NLG3_9DINO|nr:unnamed protein product [Effrenium voratum]CAJ1434032.1 unnamed protein product [Effrenium voratum]